MCMDRIYKIRAQDTYDIRKTRIKYGERYHTRSKGGAHGGRSAWISYASCLHCHRLHCTCCTGARASPQLNSKPRQQVCQWEDRTLKIKLRNQHGGPRAPSREDDLSVTDSCRTICTICAFSELESARNILNIRSKHLLDEDAEGGFDANMLLHLFWVQSRAAAAAMLILRLVDWRHALAIRATKSDVKCPRTWRIVVIHLHIGSFFEELIKRCLP